MLRVNPELLSDEPTHKWEDTLVKVFSSTRMGDNATAEVMEGDNKGKWTTVLWSKLEDVNVL